MWVFPITVIKMLKTTVNTEAFKSWITALNSLLDEATFQIANDGIRIRAMDPSQIALVDMHIKPDCFEKYSFDSKNEKENLLVDVNQLAKVLKRSKSDDETIFDLAREKVELVLKGKTRRHWKFSYLAGKEDKQKIPDIEFTAKSKTSAKILRELLKDTEAVGASHCRFSMDKQMTLVSEGDTGALNVEGITEETETKDSASSIFAVEYLEKILRAARNEVQIELRNDSPLKMTYELASVSVTYFLAPRIDSKPP